MDIQQTPGIGTGGFLRPENVLAQLDIRKGMKIADFGSGSGYFTILLAQQVGGEEEDEEKKGEVIAVDVLESALTSTEAKAKDSNLSNIKFIRANLEVVGSTKIEENSQDMVFLANILFQSNKKEKILEEAKRVLKEGGSLVVIDWFPEKLKSESLYKLSKEEMKKLVELQGFKFDREFNAGNFHYGLLFKK